VLPRSLTMTTVPGTLRSHLIWLNYDTRSIELLPRSCALAAHGRELRWWTTSLHVKRLLPPRQSRGASLGRLDEFKDLEL
jgi:hypothetical protein